MRHLLSLLITTSALGLAAAAAPGERTATFDRDPGWEGRNSRSTAAEPRAVVQDFGYSRTAHAGGGAGELGGTITPDALPAYYGVKLPRSTFREPLSASGKLNCTGRQFHMLLGFFNAGTLNEWRTPNTVALRLQGRGDRFYAYVEYATSKWRAGGDNPGGFAVDRDPASGKTQLRGFPLNRVLNWSLKYDPAANGGLGAVTATVGDETAVCHLDPGHQADGASFDRFGFLNIVKSADDGGEVWIDDVTINGRTERFDRDPGWEARGNRRSYRSTDVRPRFDFGYQPTRYAGGKSVGEIGGKMYRGDCRYPTKMACYGDPIGALDGQRPLRVSGRICLRRGVSDSTTLFGFYHSEDSMRVTNSQNDSIPANFLGLMIEGPSSEGFFASPAFRFGHGSQHVVHGPGALHILPDGTSHAWTFEYQPPAGGGPGRITVTLDDRRRVVPLPAGEPGSAGQFDRFGFVTTWVDGNAQELYLDDLTYTAG